MKKLVYSLLLCAGMLTLATACDDDNEKFDLSAAERLNQAQDNAISSLQSAENGWVMEFYSDTTKSGGFTLLAKFDAQMQVTVAGEAAIAGTHEKVTSKYSMAGDRGPVLAFSTYNRLFHLFSDPQGDGVGMQGDYEFMVLKSSKEEMILQGKKRNAIIRMYPLPAGEDWDAYLSKVDAVNEAFTQESPFKWNLVINEGIKPEDTVKVVIDKYRTMRFTRTFVLTEEDTDQPQLIGTYDTEESSTCFIITPEGLKFYNPFALGKLTLDKMEWNTEKKRMVEGTLSLEAIKMTPLQLFSISESTWVVDTLDMSDMFADYFYKASAAVKAAGRYEEGYYFYMSFAYVSMYEVPVVWFPQISGSSPAIMELKYTPSKTDPEVMSIAVSTAYNQAGYDAYSQIPEVKKLLEYMAKSYRLVADDNNNPTRIRFCNSFGTGKHIFTLYKYGGNKLFELEEEDK